MLKFARQHHHSRSSSVDRTGFVSSPRGSPRSSSVERNSPAGNSGNSGNSPGGGNSVSPLRNTTEETPSRSATVERISSPAGLGNSGNISPDGGNSVNPLGNPVQRISSPPPPVPLRQTLTTVATVHNEEKSDTDVKTKTGSDYEAISTLCLLPGMLVFHVKF